MSNKEKEPQAEQEAAASVDASENSGEKPGGAQGANASSGESSQSGDRAKIAELESELAKVREELSSVNDKYLRKLADDVNFRKRMAREKEDGQRYAVSTLLNDLIPVLDDFDRAIASAETQKDYTVLHDGVGIIRRQFGSVLESKYGLKRYSAVGQAFDPNLHEAVAMIQDESGEVSEAVVAEEYLPGYGLHDRILRTAKVRVRMPGPKPASATSADGAASTEASAASAAEASTETSEN